MKRIGLPLLLAHASALTVTLALGLALGCGGRKTRPAPDARTPDSGPPTCLKRLDPDHPPGDLVLRAACGQVRLEGQVHINSGTLTIEPGVELVADNDAYLVIGRGGRGGLLARGAATVPVIIRSDEKSNPDSWGGVELHEGADAVIIQGVVFVNATLPLRVFPGARLALPIDHNSFRDSKDTSVRLPAELLHQLGADNGYGWGTIDIEGGTVTGNYGPQWSAHYRILGDLVIEGPDNPVVTLVPGSEVKVSPGARIAVGLHQPGTLRLHAHPALPIFFTGIQDIERGPHGTVDLDHVRFDGQEVVTPRPR